MNYDPNVYTELAMKLLEGDISYVCSRYHIPGYDQEDLKQELRLLLWQKIPYFDHTRGILMRTWANTLMRNRLKNILRDSLAQKRWNGGDLPILEELQQEMGDFDNILDILEKNSMTLDDFF